ncbi:hypothetical protein ACTXT7_000275 [Hymenolepis weldensis]
MYIGAEIFTTTAATEKAWIQDVIPLTHPPLRARINTCIAGFFRRLFEESRSEYGIIFDDDILKCGVRTTPVCFKNGALDVFVDRSA